MKHVTKFCFLVIIFVLCFTFDTFGANAVMPSLAQGAALEVSSTIPIPADIFASVVETLRERPVDIFPGNRLIITSLDQTSDWALMTIAVEPILDDESILANSALVIARFDSNGWVSAILGTDQYEELLNEAPITLVSAEVKPFISARPTGFASNPMSIGTTLRWPWPSNQTWKMTQGPHSWWGAGGPEPKSALDFAPLGGDLHVTAAATGTIIRRCDSTLTREIAIRHTTGTSNDDVTGYLHLDINGAALAVGTSVNVGDPIGTIYNGPPNDTCGRGTGAHLHFWIATIPSSVSGDHPSIYNFSFSSMYGQTISGWQMQSSDNCFHKGSERPLCPGSSIPGDGSSPGPRAPSNLSANAVSSSQIDLSWSGSPDSVDGYRVYSGNAMIVQVTSTNYSISGLSACSTYSFYVKAYKGNLESGASNTASAKTSGCSSGAPSAPALNSPSNGQAFGRYDAITLVWNNNGSYRYLVEFWGGPDGGKSNLPWQSATSLYFGNGNWGGNYSWHVKAMNSSGQVSDWSATWSFSKKFGTPTNVSVSPSSATQAHLTWSPSADAPGNIEGYKIYRDDQLRVMLGADATSYDDYDLPCNTNHSYYLKAYKGDGESDASSTVWVTTNTCPPPAPSANFDAWPQSGSAPLIVAMHIVDTSNISTCSWDYGDGQTGTSCASSHNHTYSNPGTYSVRLDVSGPGGTDSMSRSGYITVSGSTPSTPSNFRVTGVTKNSVTMAWDDTSNETGYKVYTWNGASFVYYTSLGANTISYTHNGLACNTGYYYELSAYNNSGESAHAGWILGTTSSCSSSMSAVYLPVVIRSPSLSSILNGDFESGTANWTQYSAKGWPLIYQQGNVLDITPHSGSWVAWLGGDNDEMAYIQQTIIVGSANPYLTYWYWVYSEELSCSYDIGSVWINSTKVDEYGLCQANLTNGWIKRSIDLSAYKGQSVTLRFQVVTDGSVNSNLFIDDVGFSSSATSIASTPPELLASGGSATKQDLLGK